VDNYGIYGDVNSGTAGPGKSPTPRRARAYGKRRLWDPSWRGVDPNIRAVWSL